MNNPYLGCKWEIKISYVVSSLYKERPLRQLNVLYEKKRMSGFFRLEKLFSIQGLGTFLTFFRGF